MDKKRSVGVTIFGYTNIIFFGFLGLLGCFLWLYRISIISPAGFDIAKMGLSNVQYFSFIVLGLFSSIVYIFSGFGLLKLNEQARRITILLAVYLLCWTLIIEILPLSEGFCYLLSMPKSINQTIFRLTYYIITIFYFTRPKVKEQFK